MGVRKKNLVMISKIEKYAICTENRKVFGQAGTGASGEIGWVEKVEVDYEIP